MARGFEREVIHLNIVDFAAAVERLREPRLRGRPVIIAPAGGQRAGVYDMNEEAYQAGVRKNMPLYRAQRRCRDAAVLAPRPQRYAQAMARVVRRVMPYSPLIETGEMDGHLFVDVTGTGRLHGPARDAARRMARQIRRELGFCPAWAVAANKLVAKVATRLVKPAGQHLVGPGDEAGFLSPLDLDLIPGIGRDDFFRLRELNLMTAGQAAGLTPEQLAVIVGRRAGKIHDAVCGIDHSPVSPVGERPDTVSAGCGLGSDTNCVSAAEAVLYRLVEKIGAELRSRNRAARRLVMAIDYADGRRCFRQTTLEPPAADDITLFAVCRRLLHKAWVRRVRLFYLYLACPAPVAFQVQRQLFSDPAGMIATRNSLAGAVDRIRQRFGHDAVRPGRVMGVQP